MLLQDIVGGILVVLGVLFFLVYNQYQFITP
jgi:hypothetical protein